MPKHKRDHDTDNYDYLLKKIKRLEKKLRSPDRHKHRDSTSPEDQATYNTTDIDLIDAWALPDEDVNIAPSATKDLEVEHTTPLVSPARQPPPPPPVTASPATAAVAPARGPGPSATPMAPSVDSPVIITVENADQPVNTDQSAPETEETLDAELLEILGTDPTTVKQYGQDIQKDLSVRLAHCATNGLTKELRKEFKDKYLTPNNCKLIDPPEINAEVKAAVSDVVLKRDKAIENKQKQLTSAISCLGEAITLLMSNKDKNTPLLKLLIDSTKILCDCQHADTLTRRNFLLNAVKKEMKDQLQNTKIDKFLFSETLADTLKSAKAINKSGADLKIPAPKPPTKKSQASKNLNWKPAPARRQPGPPRSKEPATTSTRHRPMNTSRTSQHQQQKSNRRYR